MQFQLDPFLIDQVAGEVLITLKLAIYLLVLFLAGYVLGLMVSSAFKKIFSLNDFENALVRYGAMTTKLWGSIRNFLAQYLKWFVTVLVLSYTQIGFILDITTFMSNLFWFILLTIVGLILGGVIFKVIRNALDSIGLEDWMREHKVDGAFGGIILSDIIAGILKWYVVLLFMNEGTVKLNLPIISKFISDLVVYIPGALSGIVIILVSLLLARFTSERIKKRRISYKDTVSLVVESMIVFFGIVLSLPILIKGVDVAVLTDSFKILMAGISLAIGLAGGLGLKEHIAHRKV